MQLTARPALRSWLFAVGTAVAIAILLAAKLDGLKTGERAAEGVIALIAICAIWVVPASWSLCAALVMSMFGGNWQNLGLPSSVAPDRVVLGLTLVAIAVRAPGAANRRPIRFRPLYILMYILGAYAIASAIGYGTISQHPEIFDLFDRLMILPWCVFIIAPAAFVTDKDRRLFIATLVGMGLYLGFTGIFEILGPHALVFPRYINNPNVGIHWGRARGPFVEAEVNGTALYACILASMVALRTWTTRWPRVLATLGIAVCAISLILTFDRTTWLAVGVSAPLTLAMVPALRRYLLPTVVVAAAAVGISYLTIPTVREHIQLRSSDSQTVRDREALDGAAEAMILQRPLFGFGWGRFIPVARTYYQTSNSYSLWLEKPIPLHDVYLSIATDLGLIGLALWLPILLVGVGKAVFSRRAPPAMRPWRVALGALFTMWLVAALTSPISGSFQGLIIWLWAAVIVSSEPAARQLAGVTFPIFESARRWR
jgi:putative inorganic carbon (HCO3(-)) transporter